MPYASTHSPRVGMSNAIQLLFALLVMLGLTAGAATAQVTDTTEADTTVAPEQTTTAQQQQELTDATIMDIFITSNQAEVTTSEVIAEQEAQPPMEQAPPEDTARVDTVPEDTARTDTLGAQQDTTVYGGQGQQQPPMGETTTGVDPQVQQFAQRMIDEHTRLMEQAQQLSDSLGIQPESNLVSEVMQSTVEGVTEDLRATSPDSLDEEYMITQVVLHQQTLNMLEHSLIPNAEEEAVANLLQTARQTVEQHLEQARDIFLNLAQQQIQPAE